MYGCAKEIMPMKVWSLPKNKKHMKEEICSSGKYFGQIKKDGWWYQYEKDLDGNSFLFSRDISKVTGHLSEKSANVPHIINFLSEKLPNGTIIIGEIFYPDLKKTSKNVSQIMGCDADKVVLRQESDFGKIHYFLYDIIMFNGIDCKHLNNFERYNLLCKIFKGFNFHEFPYIQLAEIFEPSKFNLSELIDKFISDGEEGMVLKSYDGMYIPDKKPAWNMIKFKCENEADVICLGFKPPTKCYNGEEIEKWLYWQDSHTEVFYAGILYEKSFTRLGFVAVTKPYFMGWIGSITVGVLKDGKIVEVGDVHSGLSEVELEEIKSNPDKFIGEPLEVKFMPTSDYDGVLRHPRFSRWRNDLNQSDCTYEKIWNND